MTREPAAPWTSSQIKGASARELDRETERERVRESERIKTKRSASLC